MREKLRNHGKAVQIRSGTNMATSRWAIQKSSKLEYIDISFNVHRRNYTISKWMNWKLILQQSLNMNIYLHYGYPIHIRSSEVIVESDGSILENNNFQRHLLTNQTCPLLLTFLSFSANIFSNWFKYFLTGYIWTNI